MSPSRPQDPRTLKIRDEEDDIKTLSPSSRAGEVAETVFPDPDATALPGAIEAPRPKRAGPVTRGGAAATRPPELAPPEPNRDVHEPAPARAASREAERPRPASRQEARPAMAHEVREVAAVPSKRPPTETVLRPRTELKKKSSWVVWLFAFLILGGIGFGVSWFLINPGDAGGGAGEESVAATPTTTAPAEPTTAAADAGAAQADTADTAEPNPAPLPTEVAASPDAVADTAVADAAVADTAVADAAVADAAVADTAVAAIPDAATSPDVADAALAGAPDTALAAGTPDVAVGSPDTSVADTNAQVVAPAVTPRNPAEANRLNEAGLAARKAGDHARAQTLYVEALKFNPDNVWARYNLACELALSGRSKEAYAELTTLYKLGTPEAKRALAAARKDSDFESIKDSGQFFRLTNF